MSIKIIPKILAGTIQLPPSKSYVHRILIADFLCNHASNISAENFEFCEDTAATFACLKKLEKNNAFLNCGESASTFRFLLPLATSFLEEIHFILQGSLSKRPVIPFMNELAKHGVECEIEQISVDSSVIHTKGFLQSGVYNPDSSRSSQLLSGLLLTLPKLQNDSEIHLSAPPVSAPYVKMTLKVLENYGVLIEHDEALLHFYIKGNQNFTKPKHQKVEGDFSAAAYFLVAGELQKTKENGRKIAFLNLPQNSLQADSKIPDFLALIPNLLTNKSAGKAGRSISLADCPDLLPILAVYVANLNLSDFKSDAPDSAGSITFTDISRLRTKESDRIKTTAALINSTGGRAVLNANSLTVFTKPVAPRGLSPHK